MEHGYQLRQESRSKQPQITRPRRASGQADRGTASRFHTGSWQFSDTDPPHPDLLPPSPPGLFHLRVVPAATLSLGPQTFSFSLIPYRPLGILAMLCPEQVLNPLFSLLATLVQASGTAVPQRVQPVCFPRCRSNHVTPLLQNLTLWQCPIAEKNVQM